MCVCVCVCVCVTLTDRQTDRDGEGGRKRGREGEKRMCSSVNASLYLFASVCVLVHRPEQSNSKF